MDSVFVVSVNLAARLLVDERVDLASILARAQAAGEVRRFTFEAPHLSEIFMGLIGDTADGYPGLPGWGSKSAAAVLAKFGSIMEEVNKRTGKLRRATRKLPDDTAEAATIEALALQALAHRSRGERAAALTALERALRLAEPEGYVRLFADLGLPMVAVTLVHRRGYFRQTITPEGVQIEEGLAQARSVRELGAAGDKTLIEIVLAEGRKREVRRMFQAVGLPLERLAEADGHVRLAHGEVELLVIPPAIRSGEAAAEA